MALPGGFVPLFRSVAKASAPKVRLPWLGNKGVPRVPGAARRNRVAEVQRTAYPVKNKIPAGVPLSRIMSGKLG